VRWDNLTIDAEARARLPGYSDAAVVRHFDAPEALDIRFYEVRAKSALNRVPERSRMPFRWTINPYRGCSHACVYCFARPTHTYLDMNAGRDFEREIVVKVNAPEVVRTELARSSWKGEHIAMGTNTDPYQWVEGRYRLMRGIWEALRDFANPCSVLTKSPLLLRDLDLMLEIAAVTEIAANLSIPTMDEKPWRASEPHTPSPRARMEAVAELNRAGIPTGILVAPLMPGVNDDPRQVERILEAAGEAGATGISGIALHLRGEVRGIFMDWLRSYRPDLVERYEALYARGAYVSRHEQDRLRRLLASPRPRAVGEPPRRSPADSRGVRRATRGSSAEPTGAMAGEARRRSPAGEAWPPLPLRAERSQRLLGPERSRPPLPPARAEQSPQRLPERPETPLRSERSHPLPRQRAQPDEAQQRAQPDEARQRAEPDEARQRAEPDEPRQRPQLDEPPESPGHRRDGPDRPRRPAGRQEALF
jgi:DNA repair photolyase